MKRAYSPEVRIAEVNAWKEIGVEVVRAFYLNPILGMCAGVAAAETMHKAGLISDGLKNGIIAAVLAGEGLSVWKSLNPIDALGKLL